MTEPTLKLVQGDYPSLEELVPQSELSLQAQRLIEYASKPNARPSLSLTKRNIAEHYEAVFELIGGVPRLAIWADQNPAAFYAMHSKLLPSQAKIQAEMTLKGDPALKEMTTEQLKQLVIKNET